MTTKFLWIEDNARTDLKHMLAPVFMSGKYDPIVAQTVAEGVYHLRQTEFKAVVVDIRLLPGSDPDWEKLYLRLGATRATARLGLHLLYSLFGPRADDVRLEGLPEWIRKKENRKRFGVLTVETLEGEIAEALRSFDIKVSAQKTASTPGTVLLKMVEEIVAQSADGGAP